MYTGKALLCCTRVFPARLGESFLISIVIPGVLHSAAGREGRETSPTTLSGQGAISGSGVVLWEREAGHRFLGMEAVGKAFLVKTLVVEASAEADSRPWSIKC